MKVYNKVTRSILTIICLCLFTFCSHEEKDKIENWPKYLSDNANSHYSALSQIDTSNVQRLKVAWEYHTGDLGTSGRSQECNPLIINGVLYGTSPKNKLFAVKANTGDEIWRFDPFGLGFEGEPVYTTNRGLTSYVDKNGERFIFFGAGHFLYKG